MSDRLDIKRQAMRRTALFCSLTDAELDKLIPLSKLLSYPPGITLFIKGDPGDRLFIVIKGIVRISTMSMEGRETTLNLIGGGQMFGEIALLDGGERTADAMTVDSTELLAIEKRDLLGFLEGNPQSCIRMLAACADRLRWISGLLEDRNKGPVRHGHAVADEFVGTLERALTLWRTLTFQHGRQTEMVAGVEKYRREKQCDVVVYGHTHEPGCLGDYHFNSGSWARQHDTYVVISDNGQASVWEWLGDRAIPHYATLGTV